MILQALNGYYQRKTTEADTALPPFGFERVAIEFVLLLAPDGGLIDINDNREQQGRRWLGRAHVVPQAVKRSSGVAANLLWDNAGYVLGLDIKGKPERAARQHAAFVARIREELGDVDDAGLRAVLSFLDHIDLDNLKRFSLWEELEASTGNLSFKLQHDAGLVCQRPAVMQAIERSQKASNDLQLCAVSGEADEIERLHPAIKGVWGAQSSGANIVSFNLDAFNSYGKEQGSNAPVGKHASFAYTTALNHLLRNGSRQRLQVGDSSTVFWAEKRNPLEEALPNFFGEPPKDDPDRNTDAVRALFKAVEKGGYTPDDQETRFFVLGLAPNAARIAVRFWETGTVAEISRKIAQHFRDLEIVRGPRDQPHPSLFRLLVNIASQGKADNIPPNLGGEFMRAVISGGPYPHTLLQGAVRRIRAEQRITHPRAAIIKACLNRQHRNQPTLMDKEIDVSLDKTNPNTGYRLGRLFAVLEKIQEEALGNINQTIRDKFYGAASASPLSVFSNLMKLKNHHLAKMDNKGRVTNFEKLIGEILDQVTEFPAQLALPEQGLFAIGYYHQRQDFFTKSDHKGE